MFDEKENMWIWNVGICGTFTKKELKEREKKIKEIEELKREGKYIPIGCKINPNEKFSLNFNSEQWKTLMDGDGIGPTYSYGRFKFEINYWWYSSQRNSGEKTSASSEFLVIPKK